MGRCERCGEEITSTLHRCNFEIGTSDSSQATFYPRRGGKRTLTIDSLQNENARLREKIVGLEAQIKGFKEGLDMNKVRK
jgi:hypothetical protein